MPEPLIRDELESALASLVPAAPPAANRDRVLYEAGRASRRWSWLWPASSAVLATAVVVLSVRLLREASVSPTVQTIYVHVPTPPAPAAPAGNIEGTEPTAAEDVQPPDLAYYRLQKQVERVGVDALPALPPAGPQAGPEPQPLTLPQLLGTPPPAPASPGLFHDWLMPH